ncbi:hypothetical protein T440DRAFT_468516 [Plenodomus tracheiphilus IPT5]|uniref:4'-phosphopantetheinyl transferase domain-containing protein n=1 Tax=Plenodomus tracheiphilus IPT5 TaxID=1408161 RepID=A0A6A7B8C8_9PLEO|nr:hypothetical protein T440DRAFT_468516 [Plenodomus tracheiphilus IPT5]
MPPRPFPYPLRLGNDICKIPRIRAIITSARSDIVSPPALDRFMRRIFTPPEIRYFWHKFGDQAQLRDRTGTVSQFLAGRFAAKEACRKACPQFDRDNRAFQQIMILPVTLNDNYLHTSRPQALILDAPFQMMQAESSKDSGSPNEDLDMPPGQLCEVSISHDGDYATAVALVPELQTPSPLNVNGASDNKVRDNAE